MKRVCAERSGLPGAANVAFLALFALLAIDLVVWMLDMLLIDPTGLDLMRQVSGEAEGLRQAAESSAFTLVTTGLGVLLAILVRQGRDWARLLLVAVGALMAYMYMVGIQMDAGTPFAIPEGVPVLNLVADAVVGLLGLVALVLLFLPASNAYFSRGKRVS